MYAGRYRADPTILNGTMLVSNHSMADFSASTLDGTGQIDIEGGSTVVCHSAGGSPRTAS